MTDSYTPALKPGAVLQVFGDGTVSVVDPSAGNINVVGTLPKFAMVSSVEASNVSFGDNIYDELKLTMVWHDIGELSSSRFVPPFPGHSKGTAGRLHGTLNTSSGCLSDANDSARCVNN